MEASKDLTFPATRRIRNPVSNLPTPIDLPAIVGETFLGVRNTATTHYSTVVPLSRTLPNVPDSRANWSLGAANAVPATLSPRHDRDRATAIIAGFVESPSSVFFADMIVGEDEPLAAGRVLQPKIEAEVAFRGPERDRADAQTNPRPGDVETRLRCPRLRSSLFPVSTPETN